MSQTLGNQSHLSTPTSRANQLAFVIDQMLARVATAKLCQVIAVDTSAAPPTVDVRPLVNLVDGAGVATPHGIVHGLLYFRVQAGGNAVIIDPQPGDIGFAVICDRDGSAARQALVPSNPGSARRFALPDGIYCPLPLGAAPTQTLQFGSNGITATTTGTFVINAPTTAISGSLSVHGDATINGHDFMTHLHGGVQTGSGETGGVL